jgi:uncharacterized protein YecE (DUF72 family)
VSGAQVQLFDSDGPPDDRAPSAQRAVRSPVGLATDASLLAPLAVSLGPDVHLGTSSWHFPGWAGRVWDGDYQEATLSRHGLAAYSRHPLLRSVSVDRSFHRPVDASTFARLAAQVPEDFRFVVKSPAMITDAMLRDPDSGRGLRPNPTFLEARLALESFIGPAVAGLGSKIGALVFQLSPVGPERLCDRPALHAGLDALFAACAPALPAPAVLALELRDAALLTPELAALLRRHGVRYCLGLHDRMPSIQDQLPMLRALWPGPLVCRWNLQCGLRYARAKDLFAPFDRLQAPDPSTREVLARVIEATAAAGYGAFATINNKAEGCAPQSVIELARRIVSLKDQRP